MSETANANVIPLPWVPVIEFGDRIRLVRLGYGERLGRPIRQDEFAALLGESAGTYAQWEARKNRPRRIEDVAMRAAEVTGCDAAWLLGLRPGPGGGSWAPWDSNPEPADSVILDLTSRLTAVAHAA